MKLQFSAHWLFWLTISYAVPASADLVHYFGDKVVARDEIVAGDVIVITGNLVISGHIAGSAVAYVGNITLDSTAVVDRDVIAKRGRVYRAPGAVVYGDIVEGKIPNLKIGQDEGIHIDLIPGEIGDLSQGAENTGLNSAAKEWEFDERTEIKVNYNKVDGLYLGLTVNDLPFSDYGTHFRTFMSGGYAFASHSWQGKGGFGIGPPLPTLLELSVDAYHLSYTEDSWYMSGSENTLAAFFLHEDFRDYYLREGFGTTLTWKPLVRLLTLSARYQAEQHRTLENATDWALFGGRKSFSPNLPADEGMLREFVLATRLDTRDDRSKPTRGWRFTAELELSSPNLASDFDYRRAIVDLRRYQPLGPFVNLDTRVRLGNSDGTLPLQKRFYLGGPSSLPGFGLKEFAGREFALWNIELRLHDERRLKRGFLSSLSLYFFADVGLAADQSLTDYDVEDWASDVGVGLAHRSGNFRLQVAKRTDTAYNPYVFMLRIERPF